jgi:signal transduction histidine kinase
MRGGGRPRWTARLRLTLWYGGLFLLAGLVLVGTSYVLVHQRLEPKGSTVMCSADAAGVPPRCTQLDEGGGSPAPNGAAKITSGQITEIQTRVISTAMRAFLQTMLLTLALTALLALGLGWVVAGRVLRPLQRITATARRLSERNLHQRIALDGPDDELKELADTFDRMLTRLDTAFDSQRRFAVPPEQVESLFEPFRRLEGRVASLDRGAGLGLSIVRSVARAHGGDAHARALGGGGLEVTVRLPARAEPAAAQPGRLAPRAPAEALSPRTVPRTAGSRSTE